MYSIGYYIHEQYVAGRVVANTANDGKWTCFVFMVHSRSCIETLVLSGMEMYRTLTQELDTISMLDYKSVRQGNVKYKFLLQ